MRSDRTTLGLTLIAGGMLGFLYGLSPNYDTRKAQEISSKLVEHIPENLEERRNWSRLTLDAMGLKESVLGFDGNLRFSTNEAGTGIEVYNGTRYLGLVDLDMAQNYLRSLKK